MDNNAVYREIIKIINKIIKFPIDEIENMISILEKTSSYTIKFPLEKYFNLNESKVLKKIGNNKKLKELLEFILNMKIISGFCKELKECNGKLSQKEAEFMRLKKEIKIKQKKDINQLIKQIEKKNKRLIYLENKQNNLDEFIQQKISEKIKKYEDKIKQLEKENKELNNILGGEL